MVRFLSICLLFLAGFFAVPLHAADPISPLEVATDTSLRTPRLSPNGKVIAAYRHNEEEGDTLFLISADDPSKFRRMDFKPTHIGDIRWAGDQKLLLQMIREEEWRDIKYHASRLFIVDLTTFDITLADKKARGFLAGDILHIDDEGSSAIVASQDDWDEELTVKRIDLSDGSATVLEKDRGDVWKWMVDEEGTVRAGIAVDGNKYRIYYRDKPGEELQLIKGEFEQEDDLIVDSFVFGLPGSDAIAITNKGGDRFAAYEFDFTTGQLGKLVFDPETADLDSAIVDDNYLPVGFRYHDDRPRVHWLDPDLKRLQARLDNALPDRSNRIVDFARDAERVLVHSTSPTHPGTYFLLDEKNNRMAPVISSFPKLGDERLSMPKSVRYEARDGLSIDAYLTLPKDREAKNLPLILLPHGGPFSRDTWSFDPLVQYFTSRGYAVFQPQFRGSTGKGRTFVEAGSGQWGRAMQDDLNDGLAWLGAQGTIDPSRVCIVGASYGGYAAMWGAIRDPELYRCAASFAGVSDLSQMLKEDKDIFAAKRYYRDWRDRVAGNIDRRDLDVFSPVDQAHRLKVPLFLAHGEEDEVVPVDHSKDMEKALRKAGVGYEVIYYPGLGHSPYYTEHFADWLNRLGDFVARYNPS